MHNVKSSEEFRQLIKHLRTDINAALEKVAKEHGVATLQAANATFDPSAGSFTFKLEGVLKGAKGKEATSYEQLKELYYPDLPPLGFIFNSRADGQRHTVIGANRGRKIISKRTDGRMFLWPVPTVLRLKVEAAITERKTSSTSAPTHAEVL